MIQNNKKKSRNISIFVILTIIVHLKPSINETADFHSLLVAIDEFNIFATS